MPPKEFAGEGGGKPQGIMDGQMDWGVQNGGRLFDCFNCQPCCSGRCCACWYFCWTLQTATLWSWGSNNGECGFINHVIPAYYCYNAAWFFIRYAVRTRIGVEAGGPCNGFCGDCICAYFCGPCAFCQELRGAHMHGGDESFDCLMAIQDKRCKCFAPGCKSFRPLCGGK